MIDKTWKDQAAACRAALELVRRADWEGVEQLTASACGVFPDSLALVGTRMNALSHLDRTTDAVELGINYIKRFPDAEKILRNLLVLLPTLTKVEPAWLPVLSNLRSDVGYALYVRALVMTRKGIDAEFIFKRLNSNYPDQKLLNSSEFATILSAADLYESAERVLQSIGRDGLLKSAQISSRVDLLLKLASKGQPERFGEAKQLAEALWRREPDSADSWYAMGRVWWDASRMDRALPYLRRFIERLPKHPIRAGVVFNSIYDEAMAPTALYEMHCAWGDTIMKAIPANLPAPLVNFKRDRPLRVGYVSFDFGAHPVGYFAITTIPSHDNQQVEPFLYSQRDSTMQDDALSREFRAAVGEDRWRWIPKLSARQLFDQIREDKIDILVDLGGHTTGNRIEVFGMRAAPVQVSWLGYPHSTGMPTIDYRISDAIIDPEGESEQWSTEKIVRLPHGFHSIRMPEGLPEPSAPPCVTNGYLTFGSFNNVNKIGNHTIEMWASLLSEIPDARLMLKHRTMNAFENREGIRSLFAFFGVDPQRLRFVGTTPGRDQHFAMYSQMDIALDPLGYNGTTTTCEALYMGVPVLTLPGRKHASRVSASLLHRVGLDAWVAKDKEHFLKIGSYAARNFDKLTERRARLRRDFLNSPLNDGQGLARELEKAFRKMWHTACDQNQSNLNS